jgi:predicted O-methyltransferase YrrM
LYDDVLADVLLERSADDVHETVRFLCEALGLSAGDLVFDQCAGIGSVSVPLAQAGMRVISVEQAPHYVERAQAWAGREGVELQALVGDAFELASPIACRGAFNWWTGFGYADSDEQNLRMLARAFDSLAPGGAFVLDWLNVPGILRDFAPRVVTQRKTAQGEVTLTRDSVLCLQHGRLEKTWSFQTASGQRFERRSAVRLYLPHQLGDLLTRAGFTELSYWGDIRFASLEVDSPRCIVRARRPQ